MLKLSKKIEYGIQAVQYMAIKAGSIVSAKEISEKMNIPFDFLSKTLQVLNKNGLIVSQQGIKGGYVLSKEPAEITIAEIINALEENSNIVECYSEEDGNCVRVDDCTIKNPMNSLQKKLESVFHTTTIAEFSDI